jgi:hypothetical protein
LNRNAILKACYFMVIAQGEKPSERTVSRCFKLNTGKGIRHLEVLLFLRSMRGTLGEQSGNGVGTPRGTHVEHKNAILGNTMGNRAGTEWEPSRARHKVLELEENLSMREPIGSLSGEEGPKAQEKPATRVRPELPSVAFEPQDEHRVALLLAVMAGQNKSGTLAATRVAGERAKLRALLDKHGSEAWRYACDDVAARPGIRDPVPYAAGIMRGYDPVQRLKVPAQVSATPLNSRHFERERPLHEIGGVAEGETPTWRTLAARFAGRVQSAPDTSPSKTLPETTSTKPR